MEKHFARVDGWPINVRDVNEAVEHIVRDAGAGESFACHTLNLDHLVKLRRDEQFRKAYESARFITADGAPVTFIARRECVTVQRTTGADLLEPICLSAAAHGLPVYFFGSSPEVLRATTEHLTRLTHGKLQCVGAEAPPQGFDPNSEYAESCLQRIESTGARLCFLLLGAPKQELLAARAVSLGIKCGFICCGAAGDFIAGHQSRAPLAMQAAGMEWLWRLLHNPRRLSVRYARCAMLLAQLEIDRHLQRRAS